MVFKKSNTLFPHTVSKETILFWIWKLWKIQIVDANFNFLPNKLNFCLGNYWRQETIQERKLYEEMWPKIAQPLLICLLILIWILVTRGLHSDLVWEIVFITYFEYITLCGIWALYEMVLKRLPTTYKHFLFLSFQTVYSQEKVNKRRKKQTEKILSLCLTAWLWLLFITTRWIISLISFEVSDGFIKPNYLEEHSPTCMVPLFGLYLFSHMYGSTFYLWIVCTYSHTCTVPSKYAFPFLGPC